jgi:hypothetical protein
MQRDLDHNRNWEEGLEEPLLGKKEEGITPGLLNRIWQGVLRIWTVAVSWVYALGLLLSGRQARAELSPVQQQRLEELRQHAAEPFDASNDDHRVRMECTGAHGVHMYLYFCTFSCSHAVCAHGCVFATEMPGVAPTTTLFSVSAFCPGWAGATLGSGLSRAPLPSWHQVPHVEGNGLAERGPGI